MLLCESVCGKAVNVCECVYVIKCGRVNLCAGRCLNVCKCVCVNECGFVKLCAEGV